MTPSKGGCAFCRIITDRPPWALFHADEIVSFKPFGAVNKQHRMFVPVMHVATAADSPVWTGKCFEEAARWAAVKAVPFNLVVNSGAEAGQSVFHLHIHYVPREADDGLGYLFKREGSNE